ncbi:MAG: hypothetical protein J7M38_04140 [Armatimonadetes bacterium]|nr:hypothetical protein [Armatimonadota bacterium]
MGCTIGAKILEPGREFVLFKNKDFPRERFTDQLVIEPTLFGVRGLHIPAVDPGDRDILSGFSIGVNDRGVCACNSHVRSVEGGANYDDLTEAAVRDTAGVSEAMTAVREGAGAKEWNWANIIVAAPDGIGIVEIAGDTSAEVGAEAVARANSHLLAHAGAPAGDPCPRARAMREMLDAAGCVEDIMTALRWHDPVGGDHDICGHNRGGKINTVYSYILHWRDGEMTLHVCQGHPCEVDYVAIPLRFPLDAAAVTAVYPAR